MSRTTNTARVLALALVCSAASAPAASADTTSVEPSPAEARTFATTNGGWTSAVDYGGLVCIPGVTCPTANPSYRNTGGAAGAADGHLRSTFGTLLGVLSTTTIAWTSPTFVAPAGVDEASLTMQVRPQIASLLAIGQVRLTAQLVDVADGSRSTALTTQSLTAASAGFGPRTFPVPAGAIVAGRTYRIRIGVAHTTNVSAVTSGNVDIDDVALTLTDLSGPSGLTATVPANGPSRVTGAVDAAGVDTDVVVEYGTTTAYGTTTSPVRIAGSTTGAQPFSIALPDLTPGATYHYRATATNADGTSSTADATFVAPVAPIATAPTASGADDERERTVTFARGAGVTDASVEVLGGDGDVVATVADADADGSVAITLPDADGSYAVRVVRVNDAGLRSVSPEVTLVLDRVGPSVSGLELTVSPPAAQAAERVVVFVRPSDAVTVSAQVIDADDAPVGAPVAVAGSMASVVLGAADGAYRVRLTLADAAGNETQATSAAVTRDRVAPTAGPAPTVTGPATARARQVSFERATDAATAAVEVLDADDHVVDTVAVPTGASANVVLPDADGEHRLRVRQTDAAGNASTTPATTVTLDRVAPDVSALAPTVGPARSAARERTVSIVRPADAETVTAAVIDADGHEHGSRTTVVGSSGTVVLGTADGDYRVELRVTDAAGNTAMRTTAAVFLDATPPVAGPAPAVDGEPQARARTVAFTRAADAVSVAIEIVDEDDDVVGSVAVPAGGTGTVTLPDRDGDYRIRVRQTDDLGNDAVTPATPVTLDRVGPAAGPAPTAGGDADGVDVRFERASDTVAAYVDILDDAGTVVRSVLVEQGGRATVALPAAAGRYTVRVVQVDAAGNRTTTGATSVERAAPVVAPDRPAPVPAAATGPAPGAGTTPAAAPGCARPGLVLTRAALRGDRVRVSGWSGAGAGTRVAIVDLTGRQIGAATTGAGGTFSADVPAPRTAKGRRTVGYRALAGARRSHAVVLRPDNRLRSVVRTGTTVVVRGRVDLRRVGRVSTVQALGSTGACPTSTVVLRPLAAATVDRRTGDYVLRVAVPAEGRVLLRTRVVGARSIHRSGYAVR